MVKNSPSKQERLQWSKERLLDELEAAEKKVELQSSLLAQGATGSLGQLQPQFSEEIKRFWGILTNALDAINEAVVLYDKDKNLVFANQKHKEFYPDLADLYSKPGTPLLDILMIRAKTIRQSDPDFDVDGYVEDRLKCKSFVREERQLPDGRWIRLSSRRGRDQSIITTRLDITGQKEAQRALELEKAKAQEANAAKSNFLATMSHEIRTPLSGVLGVAQLLGDSDLGDKDKERVETILSSGKTLLAIINDVLDMSRIEAGHMELEETLFDFKDLVSVIATPFQSLAEAKGVKLVVNIEGARDRYLMGDPVRFRQILWNLLSNAVKFTKHGTIRMGISIGATNSEKTIVQVSVEDSGVGIASDRVDAIFDAFTQEDNSTTRKFGGTGLGLSIVKKLVEMMGGDIAISSKIGVGTRFDIDIPFAKVSEDEVRRLTQDTPSELDFLAEEQQSLKIIVAEDNSVNAMIATSFLTKLNHEVRHAENGIEAVRLASENWADLILMDIHMPEMDGVEAAHLIRSTKEIEYVPIIALTAEAFTEHHKKFREVGMDDVITKPFTEHRLKEVVGKFGAKNRL
ncbi:MAG: ATP-binding protein [Sneathiella sp.]